MSQVREHLSGPAPVYKKLLRRNLRRMGVDEDRLPRELQDVVVKKSKKGPIGALVVRDFTGLESNTAHKIVKKFEANTGGHEDIAEKLEAVKEELRPEEKALLDLLLRPHRKSLAHLIAEVRAEPTRIMRAYAKGCVELGKVQAAIIAHTGLPAIAKDLVRHALDGQDVCKLCIGSGKVRGRKNAKEEDTDCPMCSGSGKSLQSSEYKEFAIQKVLEITKQIGSGGPMVQVNQQTVVNARGGGGFFERMLETSDKILYPEKAPEPPIEAEVIDAK